MLAKFFFKTLMTNKSLWGWGVAFMVFWLFMGAYVFGFRSTSYSISLYNAAVWYALIALISASTLATSISYSIYYANSSLAYSFRYTRLSPSSYIGNLMVSTSIMGGILGALMLVFTFAFFSNKSGYTLAPVSPEYSVVVAIVAGAFMFLLATVLIILVNNYMGLRNISFASFVPTILTYVFGFSQLGLSLPVGLIYASPFTEISDLFFQAYYGNPANLVMSNPSSQIINPYHLIAGLVAWILVLSVVAVLLIKKIRPRSIEEGRQI